MVLEQIKKYKRVLLLQGPKSSFFAKFGSYLRKHGIEVYKVNLNGGDLFFYPLPNALSFTGKISEWKAFVKDFINKNSIECIFFFAEPNIYHQIAVNVAKEVGIDYYVFEHGYIRPDYITIEKNGINGNSLIPKNPEFYLSLPEKEDIIPTPVNFKYRLLVINSITYHLFELLLRWRFPHFRFLKYPSILKEAFCHCRSLARKIYYNGMGKDQNIALEISKGLKKRYFLVPLQVPMDSQVVCYSEYSSINEFIEEVLDSFSRCAPKNTFLIMKHHPADRGHNQFGKFIQLTSSKYGVSDRVIYVHDLHLPSLLDNAIGCVMINSTVGISSLCHGVPVKTMGIAIYDMPGLTYQGKLDSFWQAPGSVDMTLYKRFLQYLKDHMQLNSNFYSSSPFDYF